MAKFKHGTYTGTGAAINVSLGWQPDYLKVYNFTDGDKIFEYTSDMTDGYVWEYTKIADNGSTGSNSFTLTTSNGVTPYAGSTTSGSEAGEGFTVGTAMSESAKVFHYVAFCDDD